MIEPIWLKKTIQVNGFPKEVEVSAIDVAVKLNELISVYNQHEHEFRVELAPKTYQVAKTSRALSPLVVETGKWRETMGKDKLPGRPEDQMNTDPPPRISGHIDGLDASKGDTIGDGI